MKFSEYQKIHESGTYKDDKYIYLSLIGNTVKIISHLNECLFKEHYAGEDEVLGQFGAIMLETDIKNIYWLVAEIANKNDIVLDEDGLDFEPEFQIELFDFLKNEMLFYACRVSDDVVLECKQLIKLNLQALLTCIRHIIYMYDLQPVKTLLTSVVLSNMGHRIRKVNQGIFEQREEALRLLFKKLVQKSGIPPSILLAHSGLSTKELKKRYGKTTRNIVDCRRAFAIAAKKIYGNTYTTRELAAALNLSNHSTILHYFKGETIPEVRVMVDVLLGHPKKCPDCEDGYIDFWGNCNH